MRNVIIECKFSHLEYSLVGEVWWQTQCEQLVEYRGGRAILPSINISSLCCNDYNAVENGVRGKCILSEWLLNENSESTGLYNYSKIFAKFAFTNTSGECNINI